MFPLDNLTKVSTDSFSEVYFYFGRVCGPERTEKFVVVP